jgi:hypothetical protein
MNGVLTATHEFSGMGDYWRGSSKRNTPTDGCLFAFYGAETTMRDCVDQWVDDFWNGGDCEAMPDDITQDDVRAAIVEALTEKGLADYNSGSLCEQAIEYGLNNPRVCRDCAEAEGDNHFPDCSAMEDLDPEDDTVMLEDCAEEDGCDESPIWIISINFESADDGWELCQYDECPDLGDLSGKWAWVNADTDEEEGPYGSDTEALENSPRIV